MRRTVPVVNSHCDTLYWLLCGLDNFFHLVTLSCYWFCGKVFILPFLLFEIFSTWAFSSLLPSLLWVSLWLKIDKPQITWFIKFYSQTLNSCTTAALHLTIFSIKGSSISYLRSMLFFVLTFPCFLFILDPRWRRALGFWCF